MSSNEDKPSIRILFREGISDMSFASVETVVPFTTEKSELLDFCDKAEAMFQYQRVVNDRVNLKTRLNTARENLDQLETSLPELQSTLARVKNKIATDRKPSDPNLLHQQTGLEAQINTLNQQIPAIKAKISKLEEEYRAATSSADSQPRAPEV